MIQQTIEKSRCRLTPQEIEQMTQPLYERSLAEMKSEWGKRFLDCRQKGLPVEIEASGIGFGGMAEIVQ